MSNTIWTCQFSYWVMSNSANPWTAARQASLSISNSWSLLKLISSELVKPSNHLIFCRPLLLLPSIFPSISVFSKESVFCMDLYRVNTSEREKQILCINTYIWNLEKLYCWTYFQGSNGDTDIENRLMERGVGGERVGQMERVAWMHIHYHM